MIPALHTSALRGPDRRELVLTGVVTLVLTIEIITGLPKPGVSQG